MLDTYVGSDLRSYVRAGLVVEPDLGASRRHAAARRNGRIEPREAAACVPLARARHEEHGLPGRRQAPRAEADPLRRRLRGLAHGDCVRRVGAEAFVAPREQARRMAVLAEAEEGRVERADPVERATVGFRGPLGSEL